MKINLQRIARMATLAFASLWMGYSAAATTS